MFAPSNSNLGLGKKGRMIDADQSRVLEFYCAEKMAIQQSQFRNELLWQVALSPSSFTEQELLREAAWVILCTGFKESVLRKTFNYISLCFCDWESARVIVENSERCRATALVAFKNTAKICAIIEIARIVKELGFEELVECIRIDPIGTFEQFPYIGPVTAYHLAKNLMREARPASDTASGVIWLCGCSSTLPSYI
jgi:hypothetical protein